MDKLDKTDIEILKVLQENSRLTTKEVAARVHLTTTPVFERIKRLEENGYIRKYMALLDPIKLNRGFEVYCCIKLEKLTQDIVSHFTMIIKDVPEVTECYNVSGQYDFLLKIYAADMNQYREFVINVLGHIPGLGSLTSMFVMDSVKHALGLPL